MADGVAHIRWFKPKGGWVQRIGCFVDGELRYMYDSWKRLLIDVRSGEVIRHSLPSAATEWRAYPMAYDIPGGVLVVTLSEGRLNYDGYPRSETWVSSLHRFYSYGPHVFDVDSNDDSLRFTLTNTDVDLRRVIIGIRDFGRLDQPVGVP